MSKGPLPTRLATTFLLVALAMISGSRAGSQQPARVEVEFTNSNLLPSHWVLKINPDGSGEYDADPGRPSPNEAKQLQSGVIHRPIQLSPEFATRVFATARERKFFAMQCESRLKVAFQGLKRLSYEGPDGNGACEFNYSKDKEIQALSDTMVSVANTLQFGARLEMLMQHDRLGLDQEMDSLVSAMHDGNAKEILTIRDTLERIVSDEQILERVRRKARLLLAQAR